MSNVVKEIVFPLSGGCHLQEYDYLDRGIVSIPYVSVSLDKLHKAVGISQEQNTQVTVTDDIFVYGTRPSTGNSTFIIATMEYGDPKNPDVFIPELYDAVVYEWLLKQIAVIEGGVEYTEYCLLHDTELLVLNTKDPYNNVIPTTLIEVLTKALKELVESRKGSTKTSTSSTWKYFTRFIAIKEPSEVMLSDKAKRLIADMKLKDMQGTTTYCLLQGISDAVEGLEKRKEA